MLKAPLPALFSPTKLDTHTHTHRAAKKIIGCNVNNLGGQKLEASNMAQYNGAALKVLDSLC